jgi:hypothetical protein
MAAMMRRFVVPAAVFLASELGLPVCPAVEYDVYILTGQSNSLGTTGSGDTLAVPGADAADDETAFFWSNVSSTNTVYPPVLYGDSGGGITTLQTQQGDGGANPTFWGPEFGFGRTLSALGFANTLVIKASRGGGSNALWDKPTFEASNDAGHMWGHLRDTVDAALAAVAATPGDTFRVRGLLYLQGESNTAGDAAVAGNRLSVLAANLAAHIEAGHPGTTAGMKTVIGEIAASGATAARITTTTAQQTLAAGSEAYAFVPTSDLALKSDGIHFGGEAKLEIGRRMANAMAGRQIAAGSFDDVANAAGARSLVFDLAVPDGNGATNGPIATFPNPFEGFATGAGGQAAAGLVVEGSSGSVVFADYYGTLTTSDIAGGGDPVNANSGRSLTLSFVDPVSRAKAAVAGVGFELRAVGGDEVTATFLDAAGVAIHETGILADGRYGYEAIDSFTGDSASLIHQVVISGTDGSLWTLGHAGDATTPDLAYHGFVVVPEPAATGLIGAGAAAAAAAAGQRKPRQQGP